MLGLFKYGNFCTVQNVLKTLRCHYRIKTDTNVPLDERFIERMTQFYKTLSKSPLPALLERLKAIEKCGFKKYEVLGCPKVLTLEAKEIERRFENILKNYEERSIILPMIQCVQSNVITKKEKEALNECWDKNNSDGIEHVRKVLRCSGEQMLEIFAKNPRSVQFNSDAERKVEVLLECGAKLKDIWSNTSLLGQKTLPVIEQRAAKLKSLGLNPLPLGLIGRTDEAFEKIVSKLERKPSSTDTLNILRKESGVKANTLHVHKEKFDYLVEQGYKAEDILENKEIFNESLKSIKETLDRLKDQFLGNIDLQHCIKTLNSGKLHFLKARCRIKNLKLLKGHVSKDAKMKMLKYLKDLNPKRVNKCFESNYVFMTANGFSKEELSKLPIVLCHEDAVLRTGWDHLLQSDEKFRKEVTDDKVTALNRLQFHIEKTNNFRSYGEVEGSPRVVDVKQLLDGEMKYAKESELLEVTKDGDDDDDDELVGEDDEEEDKEEDDEEDEEEDEEEFASLMNSVKN